MNYKPEMDGPLVILILRLDLGNGDHRKHSSRHGSTHLYFQETERSRSLSSRPAWYRDCYRITRTTQLRCLKTPQNQAEVLLSVLKPQFLFKYKCSEENISTSWQVGVSIWHFLTSHIFCSRSLLYFFRFRDRCVGVFTLYYPKCLAFCRN